MASLAKRIVIDRSKSTVTVDGVEFPWHIGESGPVISNLGRGGLPIVTIPILCEDVEVIPETKGSDGA